MKKQDIFLILITFVVGVVAGGYLFLTGFAPQFLTYKGATDNSYSDFSIAGEIYGGCLRTDSCPSFQILSDGLFSYLPSGITTGVVADVGVLPKSLFRELQSVVTPDSMQDSSRVVKVTTCASYVDGFDYRYEVTLENDVYNVDTCGKSFSVDSELGMTLDKLWNYFATRE